MINMLLDKLAVNYDLSAEDRENVIFSCPATDLLDESKMKQLLELYTPLIKGKESAAGEAYMTSWFRGPMLGLIYMLSAWNKNLDLSLPNMTVQIYSDTYNEKKFYRCGFRIHQLELIDGPADAVQNAEWAKAALTRFFEHTVRPVFETITKAGTQKIAMLWSQLPTSLEYGHGLIMNSEDSDQVKRQAQRNYELVKAIDGERFGRSSNPFDVKFRMTESMNEPGKQVRIKYGCCLYYLVEDGNYCFTCPRLKESDREERRMACRAEAQAVKKAQ
ncbi:(2Fe-2S)-binding protein [Paenibacillus harenae]|uniref:(2Fe-2S)-binding protein n=1 Tax=Paenibacillus harenae TaxID=306543 RepID=UPI0004924FD6|nr:(2Fe-2S)-binding protein [Paenibacillus harenae]